MADVSHIKFPEDAEPRNVVDAGARLLIGNKADDAVFTVADPSAASPVLPKRGLVPAPPDTPGTTKYLCENGEWSVPAGGSGGTTYQEGTGIDIDTTTTPNTINNTGVLGVLTDRTSGESAAAGTVTIQKLSNGAVIETPVAVKGWGNAATKGVDTTITSASTPSNVPTSDVVYGFVNTNYASKATFTTEVDGLVPAADGTDEDTMFLKGDGTWAVPTNTTYGAENGVDLSNGNFSAKLVNTTKLSADSTKATETANRNYAVGLDKSGNLSVTVPWTDTTYEKETDSAITVDNTTHKIGVATASTSTAGVVQLTDTINSNPSSASDSAVPTEAAVSQAIADLPEPMVFKGGVTLTADSTDTTKCSITIPNTVSSVKEGYTFKVTDIASSPAYTGSLKLGDTLIADTDSPVTTASWVADTDWTVVPSGDEPAGTVTGVKIGADGTTYYPVTGGVVTIPEYPSEFTTDDITDIATNTTIANVTTINDRVDAISTLNPTASPSGNYVNQFAYDSQTKRLTIKYLKYTTAASVATTPVTNVITKTT